MTELMLCPWDEFCNIEIHVEDNNGNDHGTLGCKYENNPYSGLRYSIYHDGRCPAGEFKFGSFYTVKDLIEAWNTRAMENKI